MPKGRPLTGAFDEIVSLGNHCRVAYNLRRTFGIQRAFPFDWWITPAEALVAFLDDPSLDRLYDPARMGPIMRGDNIFAIENRDYGIQLQHEFPRTKAGSVVADWAQHIGKARERTEFLWNRLLGAPPEARLLFVRWFTSEERKAMKRNARPFVGAVRAGLDRLFPRTAYELLLVDPPDWFDEPGIRSLWLDDRSRGWRGAPELWAEKLRGEGIAWSGAPVDVGPALESPELDHEAYA